MIDEQASAATSATSDEMDRRRRAMDGPSLRCAGFEGAT
jgi:hypothetical protein